MKTKIKKAIDKNSGFIIVATFFTVLGAAVVYNALKHGFASI